MMNRFAELASWSAMVLAIALSVGRSTSAADGLPIALLNPDRIFKTHKPFQEKLTQLQEEAKEVEQAVQARQAELETATNQLRRTPQGTPEFSKLQIQVFKLQNDLQQY